MNTKLLPCCAFLWFLGLAGMTVTRVGLELDRAALPFQVASGLWIVGGVGYTGLGLLALLWSVREARPGARRP